MTEAAARPAERILIQACTTVVQHEPVRGHELPERIRDWDEVVHLSVRHGLRPLLYRYLQAGQAVPEPVKSRLARHYQANARHNLFLTRALVELMAHFGEKGIEAVPFKGPVLAQEAYGSLLLREFKDLDVVVREQDALRAMDALRAAGYVLNRGEQDTRRGYHRCFFNPCTGVEVELHWGFTQEFLRVDLDLEEFWLRTRTLMVAGRPLRAFSLEDTLLLLCIHGGKHLWLGLGWICDVAGLLVGRSDIAWEPLFVRAEAVGGVRMVQLGLYLAHDLVGAPLPGQMEANLGENREIRALTGEVRARLFPDEPVPVGVPERFYFFLRVRERRRDRARLLFWLLRLLFTPIPEDRTVVPLPRLLHWLYPLVRLARVVSCRWRKRG